MRTIVLAVAVSLCAPQIAAAKPKQSAEDKEALDHYNKGRTHYDLGRFDDAINEFQKAYEIKPDPVYLFNIAQAYRQKGDAKNAVFFYKRYLALAPNAPNKAQVETRIAELEEIALAERKKELDKDNDNVFVPDDKCPDEAEDVDGVDDADGCPDVEVASTQEGDESGGDESGVEKEVGLWKPIYVNLGAGLTMVSLGGDPAVPTHTGFVLDGGYLLVNKDKLGVDVGAALSYAPVPYQPVHGPDESPATVNASFTSFWVQGGARYSVAPRMDVRGALGLGATWFGGLGARNPFTDGYQAASGPLGMFSLRVAAGFHYEVMPGGTVSFTPAFVYSPAHSGLRDEISSVTRFDILVGFGYSL